MRWCSTLAITLVVSVGSSAGAWGQAPARTLRGTVIDSGANRPISDAALFLDRTPVGSRTAKDGGFSMEVADAVALLTVRRPGYVPAVVTLVSGAGETDLGLIRLRRVKSDADRDAIRASDVLLYPQLARFYERRARFRQGLFLTPDDLSRTSGTLTAILRQKPGFQFICVVTRRGEWDCGQQASRGPRSIMGSQTPGSAEEQPCLVHVWSDAIEGERPLEEVLKNDVLALEAYPTPGQTPVELAGSPCATVLLWMRDAGK